jgi:hypothetical protein
MIPDHAAVQLTIAKTLTTKLTAYSKRLRLDDSSEGYPSDQPNIYSIESQSSTIIKLGSFTETATKNGGEIYYQLSDDDGTSWRIGTAIIGQLRERLIITQPKQSTTILIISPPPEAE